MSGSSATAEVIEVATNEDDAQVDTHLYWVRDLERARGRGGLVLSLCAEFAKRPMPVEQQERIEKVGGLVPLFTTEDCPSCARVLSERLRGLL